MPYFSSGAPPARHSSRSSAKRQAGRQAGKSQSAGGGRVSSASQRTDRHTNNQPTNQPTIEREKKHTYMQLLIRATAPREEIRKPSERASERKKKREKRERECALWFLPTAPIETEPAAQQCRRLSLSLPLSLSLSLSLFNPPHAASLPVLHPLKVTGRTELSVFPSQSGCMGDWWRLRRR